MIVGQSGGPTAVINASLYGVVNEALNRKDSFGAVFGMINGIEGFAEGRVMDMEELKRSGELELVKTTPGSYLGSCRYKLPKDLTTKYIRNYLKDLRNMTSVISFISEEMIRWIQ
mgnify:FL=1